jgi:ribosomal protein S5
LHGSRNKINVVMATMKALKMLQNQAPVESKNVEDKKEDTKEISQEKIVEKTVKNTTKKPTKKTIKK